MADSFLVCNFRLECPFETAVELAAFSLQGKLSRYSGFSHNMSFVIANTCYNCYSLSCVDVMLSALHFIDEISAVLEVQRPERPV